MDSKPHDRYRAKKSRTLLSLSDIEPLRKWCDRCDLEHSNSVYSVARRLLSLDRYEDDLFRSNVSDYSNFCLIALHAVQSSGFAGSMAHRVPTKCSEQGSASHLQLARRALGLQLFWRRSSKRTWKYWIHTFDRIVVDPT